MMLSTTTIQPPPKPITSVGSSNNSSSSKFDLADYNAIEEVAHVAASSRANPIITNVEPQDKEEDRDQVNHKTMPSTAESSFLVSDASSSDVDPDISRTRTFSSGLISNFDDLELEYDTFTGSVGNPTTNNVDHSLVSLDITNDTEHDSTLTSIGESDLSMLNSTSLQPDTLPGLAVGKSRMKYSNSQIDFHKIANLTRTPSQFTVTKVAEGHTDLKLKQLNKQFEQLSIKIKKIERELKFLDDLMPDISSQMVHSIEAEKLRLARDKLFDRCEQLKKQRYELSIKLNNKFKSVYGVNGADKAQYWVRGVSS